MAGSLVLDLNEDGVFAEPAEADDRRNVFQLNTAKQRRLVIIHYLSREGRKPIFGVSDYV